jgi:hypothetical protein
MRSARSGLLITGAVCIQTLFAWLVLAGLDAPLLWEDEAETAMWGRRILEFGYPKVHGRDGGVLYGVHHPTALGIRQPLDAYVGSPWGQYYFAAAPVAWSDAADDLAERTWRVRLPFAVAGWLGTVLLGIVGASSWPPAAGGRARFWLGYGVCLVLSVSLQLHLREVRYYPLVVLGVSAAAWLAAHRHVRGDLAPLLHTLLLAPVLWILFNLFYPVFAAITATAGCALGLRALRSPASARVRALELTRDAAPYLLAFAAALPLVAIYGISDQDRSFADTYGPANPLGRRIGWAAWYLLRYELVVPAVLGALALGLALRRAGSARGELRVLVGACHLLLGLVAIWVALVARTPLFFERYLVALSPVLGIATVLAVGGLLALRETPARRCAQAGIAAIALALAGSAAVRVPELRGRWTELLEPYRGPLDHVIPYLAERYPDPAELVIATNYEDFSYMFYLRAKTTFGFYAPLEVRIHDLETAPDVIIPRPWMANLRALQHLAAQGEYVPHEFPVANVLVNNLPELSHNPSGAVHRFTSPVVGRDGKALVIGERRAAEGGAQQAEGE